MPKTRHLHHWARTCRQSRDHRIHHRSRRHRIQGRYSKAEGNRLRPKKYYKVVGPAEHHLDSMMMKQTKEGAQLHRVKCCRNLICGVVADNRQRLD